MAQHDYTIDNQTSASLRADLNNALAAIVSQNSGATAPATTYANQFWYDTSTDTLKQRNESNTVWISLGTVDQTNNKFEPNQTFATQAEAEAKTDNTKAMTALRTEQAIVSRFNATGTAPFYACRAWVNFNGTGTVAIRASGNVSSITDNGTGKYTINFATALSDTNFAMTTQSIVDVASLDVRIVGEDISTSRTTSSVRITSLAHSANTGGGISNFSDVSVINVAIFR